LDAEHWDRRYREGDVPWDTGQVSAELHRVISEAPIRPCRAIELGCGTGSNILWLERHEFEVVGVDISARAIERARERARQMGAFAAFVVADALELPDLGAPFQFFFDRGCYHAVRRLDAARYVQNVHKITAPDAAGLVLAGNAREPHSPGPPVVTEEEIRREWGELFAIDWLREFHFDAPPGSDERILGWSFLLHRK